MNQKGEIEVGEKEKHNVSFILNAWLGTFSVNIDGNKTQVDGVSWLTGPFSVEVGEKEQHTITFQVIGASLFTAFRKKTIQILVDSKLYKTF